MLIYIKGSDPFLAKKAIDQIKAKYLEKNPTGSELVELDENSISYNWADLSAVPLFATSRLVVIRRATAIDDKLQSEIAHFLVNLPPTTVTVIWDGGVVKNKPLVQQLSSAAKLIEVKPIEAAILPKYLAKRAQELGVKLTSEQSQILIDNFGVNLWALETELANLANNGGFDDLMATSTKESEPFIHYRLIRQKKWGELKKVIKEQCLSGEPAEKIIGLLNGAIRKEVSDKKLATELVDLLSDIDFALKVGLIDSESALALLAHHLSEPSANRVQWEAVWGEIT